MARFDPRGKVNRALLVGVPVYDYKQPDHPVGVPGDLKAVEHNLTALERALRAGAVFREDEITVSRPHNVHEFDRRLDEAVDAAEGLLFLYFSGHGVVPSTGDALWLLMRAATIVPGTESVFRDASPWKTILTVLARTHAEQVVVVLDCCYAGNAAAAWDALDTHQRQRTSLLMSVQANNRIDAGRGDTPTPFTGQLVRFLTEGAGGGLGFNDLAERLRAHMRAHHTTLRDPPERWEPQSRPATSGADVLLAAGALAPTADEDQDGPGNGPVAVAGAGSGAVAGPVPEPGNGDGAGDGTPDEDSAADTGPDTGPDAGSDTGAVAWLGLRRRIGRQPGRRPESRPDRPTWRIGRTGRAGRSGTGRAGRAGGPGKTLTLTAGALAALAALIASGFALIGDDPAPCKPPLELRLLTDPEIESTVRKAAEAYRVSDANKADGTDCRRSGITVYSAGAAEAGAAFRDRSDAWQRPTASDDVNPQRDIGPQPDIWIPATKAAADLAQPDQSRRTYLELFADPAPFAYSPIVLAVPQNLARERTSDRAGQPLSALLADLQARDPAAALRRSDPEHTDAGLLATVGLHASTGRATEAEKRVAQPGPPAPTGARLLCELPADRTVDSRTAALVPEFLLRTGVGCHSTTRIGRMAAYPNDVPALEPTFARVRWREARLDEEARAAAVDRFHSWFTPGEGGGLAAFAQDGFRSSEPNHAPLDPELTFNEFGALADPPLRTLPAPKEAMAKALKAYRDAGGPGRVLFLLDSSGSMGDLWEGPGGAPGIIRQSLGGLGGEDQYGIWAVAAERGAERPYSEVLPFGPHGRAEAEKALAAAKVKDMEADPHRALTAALNELAQRNAENERPHLIVYITDDEDNTQLAPQGHLNDLLAAARTKGVPVVMVSLESGCDPNKPGLLISAASGGRCLDTKTDLVAGLRDEVARTGTGTGA
ncbi:caspase family protein [Streptomyces sp. NPDC002054]|uniref:caspase family protein n=1 Tax=Streptomyces sp. NPDC002054 TaxID=3154663 RepID=UPI0033175132